MNTAEHSQKLMKLIADAYVTKACQCMCVQMCLFASIQTLNALEKQLESFYSVNDRMRDDDSSNGEQQLTILSYVTP
jgi:hypothetical protein